jgi:hypothetical protein
MLDDRNHQGNPRVFCSERILDVQCQ